MRHRLVIRCDGPPAKATIELDGKQLMFVSRIEFALDAKGRTEARLTVPVEMLDLDVDAQAFVTAHVEAPTPSACAHCGHDRAAHNNGTENGCSACPTEEFAYDHPFNERA